MIIHDDVHVREWRYNPSQTTTNTLAAMTSPQTWTRHLRWTSQSAHVRRTRISIVVLNTLPACDSYILITYIRQQGFQKPWRLFARQLRGKRWWRNALYLRPSTMWATVHARFPIFGVISSKLFTQLSAYRITTADRLTVEDQSYIHECCVATEEI